MQPRKPRAAVGEDNIGMVRTTRAKRKQETPYERPSMSPRQESTVLESIIKKAYSWWTGKDIVFVDPNIAKKDDETHLFEREKVEETESPKSEERDFQSIGDHRPTTLPEVRRFEYPYEQQYSSEYRKPVLQQTPSLTRQYVPDYRSTPSYSENQLSLPRQVMTNFVRSPFQEEEKVFPEENVRKRFFHPLNESPPHKQRRKDQKELENDATEGAPSSLIAHRIFSALENITSPKVATQDAPNLKLSFSSTKPQVFSTTPMRRIPRPVRLTSLQNRNISRSHAEVNAMRDFPEPARRKRLDSERDNAAYLEESVVPPLVENIPRKKRKGEPLVSISDDEIIDDSNVKLVLNGKGKVENKTWKCLCCNTDNNSGNICKVCNGPQVDEPSPSSQNKLTSPSSRDDPIRPGINLGPSITSKTEKSATRLESSVKRSNEKSEAQDNFQSSTANKDNGKVENSSSVSLKIEKKVSPNVETFPSSKQIPDVPKVEKIVPPKIETGGFKPSQSLQNSSTNFSFTTASTSFKFPTTSLNAPSSSLNMADSWKCPCCESINHGSTCSTCLVPKPQDESKLSKATKSDSLDASTAVKKEVPSQKTPEPSISPPSATLTASYWKCPCCDQKNEGLSCTSCMVSKPTSSSLSTGISSEAEKDSKSQWKCPCCESMNETDNCSVCSVARPKADFKLPEEKSTSLGSTFNFGDMKAPSTFSYKFGAAPAAPAASSISDSSNSSSKLDGKNNSIASSTTPSSSLPPFTFSSQSSTKSDTKSAHSNLDETASTNPPSSALSFPSTTSSLVTSFASTSSLKSTSSSSVTSTSSSSSKSDSTSLSVIDSTPSSTETTPKSTIAPFGAPVVGSTSSVQSPFGALPSTSSSIFTFPSSATSKDSSTALKTSLSVSVSSSSSMSSASSTTTSPFSSNIFASSSISTVSNPFSSSSTPSSSFASSSSSSSLFLFGSAATSAPTSLGSLPAPTQVPFSQTPTSTLGSSSPFSTSLTATPYGSSSSSSFGSSLTSTTTPFNSAPSTPFGSSAASSPFNASSSSTFGSTTSSPFAASSPFAGSSSFASSSSSSSSMFGGASQTPFGSSASSSFGSSSSSATSPFGSSIFGNSSSSASSTPFGSSPFTSSPFGSTGSTTPFGGSSTSTSSNPSPFGVFASSTASPSPFGGSSSSPLTPFGGPSSSSTPFGGSGYSFGTLGSSSSSVSPFAAPSPFGGSPFGSASNDVPVNPFASSQSTGPSAPQSGSMFMFGGGGSSNMFSVGAPSSTKKKKPKQRK